MKKYSLVISLSLGLLALLGTSQQVHAGTCTNFSDTFTSGTLGSVYEAYYNPAGTSSVVGGGKLTLNSNGYTSASYPSQSNYLMGPAVPGDKDYNFDVQVSDLALANMKSTSSASFYAILMNPTLFSYNLVVSYLPASNQYLIAFSAMDLSGTDISYVNTLPNITNIKLRLSKVGKSVKAYYDYDGNGYKYIDESASADPLVSYGANTAVALTTSDVNSNSTASVKFDNWTVSCVSKSTDTVKSAIYRFKNRKNGKYFYTINTKEKSKLEAGTEWAYEKVAYNGFPRNSAGKCSSGIPMFRFYSDVYRSHFFTTNEKEKNKLITTDPNWRYEGVGYCVLANAYAAKRNPVYRLYSTSLKTHMYTTSTSEQTTFKNKGWTDEGIKFYSQK